MRLLEKLCNACGVSGDTDQVAQIILEEIRPYCDRIEVMRDGNIIACKNLETFGIIITGIGKLQ